MDNNKFNEINSGKFNNVSDNNEIRDVIINLLYELKSSISDDSSKKYSIENLTKLYNYAGVCFIKTYLTCDKRTHSLLYSENKNYLLALLQQYELNNIKNNIINKKGAITVQDVKNVSESISLANNKKFDVKLICKTWGVSRSFYYSKLNDSKSLGVLFPKVQQYDYISYLFFNGLNKRSKINYKHMPVMSDIDNEEYSVNYQYELINIINEYLSNKTNVYCG